MVADLVFGHCRCNHAVLGILHSNERKWKCACSDLNYCLQRKTRVGAATRIMLCGFRTGTIVPTSKAIAPPTIEMRVCRRGSAIMRNREYIISNLKMCICSRQFNTHTQTLTHTTKICAWENPNSIPFENSLQPESSYPNTTNITRSRPSSKDCVCNLCDSPPIKSIELIRLRSLYE